MAASTSNQASRVVVDDTAVRPFEVSVPTRTWQICVGG